MMRKIGAVCAAAALATAIGYSSGAQAQDKQLTLCWAAWDPANALVELSKDFTAESGIKMKFEFVPWTSYADRFLNELNSHGKLCDLIIGDSQWIGGSAENGHYVKLNDFFEKNGISMDDFLPATVVGYSEWPKNTPNYWALPAMGDVVGWTYRKDWFSRPELQKEFKAKYGWDLGPPKTYDQLKQIAEFFQGRESDGKKVYGASIYTERGSEGITMGVTNVLYDWCFQRLHGRVGRRLQIRPGGAPHELRLHLARPLQGPECRRRQDRLLRQSRREAALCPARRAGHLGGLLFRPPGRCLQVHQVVREARGTGQVVVARRLLLREVGAERSRL